MVTVGPGLVGNSLTRLVRQRRRQPYPPTLERGQETAEAKLGYGGNELRILTTPNHPVGEVFGCDPDAGSPPHDGDGHVFLLFLLSLLFLSKRCTPRRPASRLAADPAPAFLFSLHPAFFASPPPQTSRIAKRASSIQHNIHPSHHQRAQHCIIGTQLAYEPWFAADSRLLSTSTSTSTSTAPAQHQHHQQRGMLSRLLAGLKTHTQQKLAPRFSPLDSMAHVAAVCQLCLELEIYLGGKTRSTG
ncbi:hypothetical protein EX30DRAFT_346302 [Ascodesmis nigricans]|uniref:Uncharacterized protein n=1 Tax=Ascodesmis nigricans TaxID=341454 RepID=A0A4S2N2V7_9PEZI|nr:hypothetical protein EX30DRAFT_346302 [Ascodesmis nigricans]